MSRSRKILRQFVVLCLLAAPLMCATAPAEAMVGGSPANPSEAPWAVAIYMYHSGSSEEWHCTGEVVAKGLILTARHCVDPIGNPAASPNLSKMVLHFSNGVQLPLSNPDSSIAVDPAITCSRYTCTNDVATVRFSDQWGFPSLPVASAAQVSSFTNNQGVTLFGAGYYAQSKGQNIYPSWVEKSRNGGLFVTPHCQVATDICIRYAGAGIRGGDSGGAIVGWVGHWVLLGAVESNDTQALGTATSLGDPGVSAWVNQQIARVTPTPAPTPAPTPTPTPTPTPAAQQAIQIGWSSSHPTWITMTLNGFATGSYSYSCNFGSGGDQSFTLTESSEPQTFDNGHTCYDTIAGDTVNVTIDGVSSNTITVPAAAPAPAPPAQTWSETVGGPTNTWTNYSNAGGTQGTTVETGQTVQITCKVTGFKVADGNTWWYRIASSPWSNAYYASADAFYNNGQTSGSLHGTPFVDNAVPNC